MAPHEQFVVTLEAWHDAVRTKDLNKVARFVAKDCVLKVPAYSKPREGRDMFMVILQSVLEVFNDFQYHREWFSEDGSQWALEFTAVINNSNQANGLPKSLWLKGVDLVKLNDKGYIQELEVVMRPLNSLALLKAEMGEIIPKKLQQLGVSIPPLQPKDKTKSAIQSKI
eukprot:c17530_g1_i1.p1 GENE.c17530_g1_i1~~c17530_g1_i1.p1  ORF type:complete len:169 (-),score=45.05 c17530_g1_i1:168-674(-)